MLLQKLLKAAELASARAGPAIEHAWSVSPARRGPLRQRSCQRVMTTYGIPLDRVLAAANRHDSPLLAPTLADLGPLPA